MKTWSLVVFMVFASVLSLQAGIVVVEPDDFAAGTNISSAVAGVTLSAFSTEPIILGPVPSPDVLANLNFVGGYALTGRLVFGTTASHGFRSSWYRGDNQFRADFTIPTDFVSIMTGPDAVGDTDPARFEIYNLANVLLASIEVPGTGTATVSFGRASADIAYLIATNPIGVSGQSFILDHLEFNQVPEPTSWLLIATGLGLLATRVSRKQTSD